jgi:thiol-disulfide isomerase/thioredoxin
VSAWTRRPRLLVGSLVVAGAVVVAYAIVTAGSDPASPPVDAILDADPTDAPSSADLENRRVDDDPFPLDALLADRDGNDVVSGELVGDPLVVNFWFTTCAPCAKELPAFAAVHAQRGDEVRIVGINPNDPVDAMEAFARERGVGYELYVDRSAALTDGIGAVAFPITLFVTPDGTIVEQTGVLDEAELNDRIDALLDAST